MKNLRYPSEAQRAKKQGQVIIGFVVTSVGRVANGRVTQYVSGGCSPYQGDAQLDTWSVER